MFFDFYFGLLSSIVTCRINAFIVYLSVIFELDLKRAVRRSGKGCRRKEKVEI